jgi:hypothetical protein
MTGSPTLEELLMSFSGRTLARKIMLQAKAKFEVNILNQVKVPAFFVGFVVPIAAVLVAKKVYLASIFRSMSFLLFGPDPSVQTLGSDSILTGKDFFESWE